MVQELAINPSTNQLTIQSNDQSTNLSRTFPHGKDDVVTDLCLLGRNLLDIDDVTVPLELQGEFVLLRGAPVGVVDVLDEVGPDVGQQLVPVEAEGLGEWLLTAM